MRELTSRELTSINGGHDAVQSEHSYQTEFWNSFLHSSGFAAGIFWSPLMPFIMGGAAIGSATAKGLMFIGSSVYNGASYIAENAYALVKAQTTAQ